MMEVRDGLVSRNYLSGVFALVDRYTKHLRSRLVHWTCDQPHRFAIGIADAYATAPPIMGYLARALVDGSPAAAALFDEMVALTEQYLVSTGRFASDSADGRAYAAVFTAMKLGVTVFLDRLSRTMSITDMARDGYPRISRAMLDIISPDLVSRDMADQARAGLDRYAQEHPNV